MGLVLESAFYFIDLFAYSSPMQHYLKYYGIY
jgi:hypothetical protein